jgi:serine/threonine protein kinase
MHLSEDMDSLRPGDPVMVGGYRLTGRLGAGGMGQVFLGASPGGRKVAVKLIHAEYASDPEFRGRFTREIEAARRVGGFHTAPVVDADPGADPPWMVTAYIPGPSLQEAVAAGGPLGPAEVRALGAALAEGLAAIHACGLVHRDVKPSNVILADDGPRIIDFGIARTADASRLTATGAVLGTFSYMSPEQVRGEHAGPASDVFSLGGTLAFAAAGRPPFGSESIVTAVHRIVNEPPDLAGLPEGGELRQLITACLDKNPADRPPLSAVIARLGAHGQQDDGAARPSAAAPPGARRGPDTQTANGRPDRTGPGQTTEQAGAAGAERRRPRVTARRIVPAAAAAVVVAAAVSLIISLFPASSPPAPPGRSPSKGHSSAPATLGPVSLAQVYSASEYGFDLPYFTAVDGAHVWVANADGNSVTELNADNGGLIRILGGFNVPFGISDDGKHIWVTNNAGNSLAELSASDGTLITTLSGGSYGFKGPQTILDDGRHLWVTNDGNSVTELEAGSGAWIRTLSGGGYQFNHPIGMTFDGAHLWVVNYGGSNGQSSVTEVNASDGTLVRVVSGPQYQFSHPAHAAVADGSIWVTNSSGSAVTQINASDGALQRVLSGGQYGFDGTSGIALFGSYLFITNLDSASVDVIDARTGALQRIIAGPEYGFDYPNSITIAGSRAWVGNWYSPHGSGSVTALNLG